MISVSSVVDMKDRVLLLFFDFLNLKYELYSIAYVLTSTYRTSKEGRASDFQYEEV
jgi:hypothetical protein